MICVCKHRQNMADKADHSYVYYSICTVYVKTNCKIQEQKFAHRSPLLKNGWQREEKKYLFDFQIACYK